MLSPYQEARVVRRGSQSGYSLVKSDMNFGQKLDILEADGIIMRHLILLGFFFYQRLEGTIGRLC